MGYTKIIDYKSGDYFRNDSALKTLESLQYYSEEHQKKAELTAKIFAAEDERIVG